MNREGYVKEVFSSYQGEGKYVGARQIFIRFAGCNIKCKGCDTDYAPKDYFFIGNVKYKNPITPDNLYQSVKNNFDLSRYHSVSFTGGEPLEQFDFLKNLANCFKKDKIKLFLETSGFYSEKLLNIMDLFDIFSIDVKLTSVFGVKYENSLFEVLKSFPVFKYYLKLILNNEVDFNELYEVLLYLEGIKISDIYVQPFSGDLSFDILDKVNELFTAKGINVFFIPQLHKMLRIK